MIYKYIENGHIEVKDVELDPLVVIAAAMHVLGAEYDPEKQVWTYEARETGEVYEVDQEAMMAAGAAIMGGATGWYSIWCAENGTRVH